MGEINQKALAFINLLEKIYFVDRDLKRMLSMMDTEITWIGTGEQEYCIGIEDARAFFQREEKELVNNFTLENHWKKAIPLDQETCIVMGEIHVEENIEQPILIGMNLRTTYICRQIGEEMKLLHLHYSVANVEQEWGEFFPNKLSQATNTMLRRIVEQKSKEIQEASMDLQALTANIPGGVHRCYNDPYLTLSYYSESFLSMFGYSKEELESLFQNRYYNMVCPEDRAHLAEIISEQLKTGNMIETEYRVQKKDGSVIWILDKGQLVVNRDGKEYFYCVLVDISNTKKAQEELRLSEEKYRILLEQSRDTVFEWDMERDILSFTSNWEKTFGYPPISEKISANLLNSTNIYHEDIPVLQKLISNSFQGIPYHEEEFRIRKNKDYIWCKLKATTQFDKNNKPFKVIGVIADIDEEKRKSQKLMEKAETDGLTGLYNKGTSKSLVEEAISKSISSQAHALMIIDVDNFKQVNDKMGHLFGDAVLSDVAASLCGMFHKKDIIGRIGGDEFIVFLSNIPNKHFVEERAKNIIEAFSKICIVQNELCISGSIGISLYPNNGQTFRELFSNADKALYYVKNKGKNGFVFYDETLYNSQVLGRVEEHLSAVNEIIDSDNNEEYQSNITQYIFKILYEAKDLDTGMNLILEIIGRHYDVSRVYIFESDEDMQFYSNKYEWCGKGICSVKDNFQHLQYYHGDYRDNFDENGVFYCKDTSNIRSDIKILMKEQDTTAILQCAIMDEGEFLGFVGFDECRGNRLWTQNQIDDLSYIAEMIGIFLLRNRVKGQAKRILKMIQMLVDSIDIYIYAVDMETKELILINQKTAEFVPQAAIGKYCYDAFFHEEDPCSICPLLKLDADGKLKEPMEIYNPFLHILTAVEAVVLPWINYRRICLISAKDITDSKG